MNIQITYPYGEFELDLVIEASEAEPQTLEEQGCNAEFNVIEATLDGKCAFELIDYENWSVKRQVRFNADVEAYYIDTECGEE